MFAAIVQPPSPTHRIGGVALNPAVARGRDVAHDVAHDVIAHRPAPLETSTSFNTDATSSQPFVTLYPNAATNAATGAAVGAAIPDSPSAGVAVADAEGIAHTLAQPYEINGIGAGAQEANADITLQTIAPDLPPDLAAEALAEPKRGLTTEQLEQLRYGESAAWDTFVADWSPRLFSYLRYSLPTREDAEDALSETLVATVEAIKHFDGKSQVSTWLYSIARRKVADFWRKSSNTEELSDLFQDTPNGFSLEFREALAALPEQSRQALLLRYREGFSVSEVSEIMGRTYKATESLLSRGRALLARQLQPEAE